MLRGASSQEADPESADDGLDALVGHNAAPVTRQASHCTAFDGEAPTEGPIVSVNASMIDVGVDLERLDGMMVSLACSGQVDWSVCHNAAEGLTLLLLFVCF